MKAQEIGRGLKPSFHCQQREERRGQKIRRLS